MLLGVYGGLSASGVYEDFNASLEVFEGGSAEDSLG